MVNQPPLTQGQKEQIYLGKLDGHSLAEVAATVGCSLHAARKWWRVGRDRGLDGLRAPRRGRGKTGVLSCFAPAVRDNALALKRAHPGWGAKRVLLDLAADPALQGARLPGPSRLATFFQQQCPECVAPRQRHRHPPNPATMPRRVHEQWQLDSQEGIPLGTQDVATLCNIRDPVGGAMIASQAFSVGTPRRWRKLAWTEVRAVLRGAFCEWQTLPDELQTDNELGLAGTSHDLFPGQLTLWLAGLGVVHRLIRPGHPTDQPHIERNHRTLRDWAVDTESVVDVEHLQQALERERAVHNRLYPSHASDCGGRPPLTAHPELLRPRRLYYPGWELELFDLRRVYQCLAQQSFERKVDAKARVSLGSQSYSLGAQRVRERGLSRVQVRLNAQTAEWVFSTLEGEELMRCPPKGLDVRTLTGLDPSVVLPAPARQLALPCFDLSEGGRLSLDS